ncbi:MAG TPA: 3-oxoacyl-ACP synthase [Chryseosolibacter sp.]|nr:3-oxoacyl-ACP synthase [Chryseosolibacter sp.]
MDIDPAIKIRLVDACRKYVAEKVEHLQQAIRDLQNAANEETKSSAGDKYETGRAMAQLEIEKLTVQLHKTLPLHQALDKVETRLKVDVIDHGSVVFTDGGNYFIAISAGVIIVNNDSYFAVGINAPIALALRGKKTGDVVDFNKKKLLVKNVIN